jgi:RNA polymerase sigma-70 factor (ECF subfamily)
VRERRPGAASRAEHDAVAQAFAIALATGELDGLVAVLDPDVVLRSDGGGKVSAARRPVFGADRVARFLLGVPRLQPTAQVAPTVSADGLAFLVTVDGRPDAVVSVDVRDGRVVEVYLVRNPDKLTLWR